MKVCLWRPWPLSTTRLVPCGPAASLPLWWVWWVWNLGSWLVGVGLAHCWALRHQARKRGNLSRDRGRVLLGVCGVLVGLSLGFWGVLWLPSFACCSPVGGWWGLVGLLFEICIVDASIFVAIVLLCL